jgi:hypothetical protein
MALWHREPENHLQWLAPELSFGTDWMIPFETGRPSMDIRCSGSLNGADSGLRDVSGFVSVEKRPSGTADSFQIR